MSVTTRFADDAGPKSVLDAIVSLLGVTLTLFTVGYATTLVFNLPTFDQVEAYMNIFLGIGLALFYLHYASERFDADNWPPHTPSGSRSPLDRVRDGYARIDPFVAVALALLALAATGYVHYHFERLMEDVFLQGHTQVDYYVGVVLIVLAIDSTRRAFGNVIAAFAVLSVLYSHTLVGPEMPGALRHTGFTWQQISRTGAIEITGVYHETLMRIGATWVAIFIMFAGIAKAFGLMDFVLDVGSELGTSLRTGVVQIAVVASMIMGSITGSAAANTATTGSFTIPMLKEQGVQDDFAAAIEAVASAGGQMLPPVMGVAAFIMADLLDVPYVDIIQAGTIPAMLFYLSVGIGVHYSVLKHGWISEDLDSFEWRMLAEGAHFLIPLGVLLYTLIWLRYSPMTAGMYSIFTIVGVVAIRNAYSRGVSAESAKTTAAQTVDGLRQGGVDMAPLIGVLAAMGLIVQLLEGTGLTQRVGTLIISLGGGSLIVVLLLAMVASVLFGLGMPTPAAYILVVILVAPGVIEMGVPDIATHMFVFYFAMLSAITPPVAISVAVGSRIADTSFTRSCVQALRLGAPGFVIPYAFIANDSLIYWSVPDTLIQFPLVLSGTIGLIVAMVGYDGAHDLAYHWRAAYVVLAFGAMFGGVVHFGLQVAASLVLGAALIYGSFVAETEIGGASTQVGD